MRLFLLPISTRRTLLYCQKLQTLPTEKQPLADKVITRAAKLWAGWEKQDGGWKKAVVKYGNRALRRIPYEEWGLKSVPTLSTRRREEDALGKEKHHIVFPASIIPPTNAPQVLQKLATEREGLHRSRMVWCFIGMPISAPFALVPIIPNLPFFYLVYRAWSHYKALAGGKHLKWLISHDFFTLSPSEKLDAIYSRSIPSLQTLERKPNESDSTPRPENSAGSEEPERMLITQSTGHELSQALDIPELEIELERAIWQVETAIRKQNGVASNNTAGEKSQSKEEENKKEE
ncbi:mitochondrial K+-H+ exchange-related-domain-containing protein [Poronia punctata]|nr:mitochondrial K+-H+ exchange-related-domain-containing protein [Poronia punctata]